MWIHLIDILVMGDFSCLQSISTLCIDLFFWELSNLSDSNLLKSWTDFCCYEAPPAAAAYFCSRKKDGKIWFLKEFCFRVVESQWSHESILPARVLISYRIWIRKATKLKNKIKYLFGAKVCFKVLATQKTFMLQLLSPLLTLISPCLSSGWKF